MPTPQVLSRRALLRGAALGAASLCLPVRAWSAPARTLDLENLHTGESLSLAYRDPGGYRHTALARIDHLLRDHRTGSVFPIDPRLLDLLHDVRAALDATGPFRVISGYRSPQTNERLRAKGVAVAKQSLHVYGKAVDVRLADVSSRALREAAVALGRGGVGYYPASDFVHLDVGRVRTW